MTSTKRKLPKAYVKLYQRLFNENVKGKYSDIDSRIKDARNLHEELDEELLNKMSVAIPEEVYIDATLLLPAAILVNDCKMIEWAIAVINVFLEQQIFERGIAGEDIEDNITYLEEFNTLVNNPPPSECKNKAALLYVKYLDVVDEVISEPFSKHLQEYKKYNPSSWEEALEQMGE